MAKDKTAIKVKKKNWYEIVAPKMFDERVIGETTVLEQSALIGKPILVNLMSLTNDPKRQNINIKFKVDSVKESKAYTKFIGYYLSYSSLRRMMKRATTRIDDSFLVETSDNLKLRIKPFLLTRKPITGSVSTNMRNLTREYIIKQVSKLTYEKLVYGLVSHNFQRALSAYMKKVYPLRTSEIREMYIEKDKKQTVKEDVKEAPKEVKEEKTEIKKEVKEKPKEEKKPEVKEEKPVEKKEVKKEEVKEEKPKKEEVSKEVKEDKSE